MQNCCPNTNIQWFPDPNMPGTNSLGCTNCGVVYVPWTPQEIAPPAPPMAPFEAQVINGLNAIMAEFGIEGASPVAAGLIGEDGAPGAYQVAWENLESLVPEQKSWTSGKMASTMTRVLAEATPQGGEGEEVPF